LPDYLNIFCKKTLSLQKENNTLTRNFKKYTNITNKIEKKQKTLIKYNKMNSQLFLNTYITEISDLNTSNFLHIYPHIT
jgi:hypothetical protein